MTIASYELNNIWHGLGTVGHVALGVIVLLVVFVAWGWFR